MMIDVRWLQPELANSSRFLFFRQRFPFDDFDAFLSFCTVCRQRLRPGPSCIFARCNVVNPLPGAERLV